MSGRKFRDQKLYYTIRDMRVECFTLRSVSLDRGSSRQISIGQIMKGLVDHDGMITLILKES